MDTPREDKKSSMRRISNISTLPYYWHTITFLLLACQSIGMVRPENVVNDDIMLPLNGYKEKIPWTDGGAEQNLNSLDVISSIQNIEKPVQYLQDLKETQSIKTVKKPRFICLHGYGSNAEKLKQHFDVWPESVLEKMDLVFINGPFCIDDGITIGEQFVWFSPNKANTEFEDLEEGIAYIEDQMIKLGPFDGVLGFSQGAIVAGALPGLQDQGLCLKKVGKLEHVILISGGEFGDNYFPDPPTKFAETAYSSPINIPSLHIYGENDIARNTAPKLIEDYVDPLVIFHHGGHEVPKLDEEGLKIMFKFLKKINAII